jgi:hypothetical protein
VGCLPERLAGAAGHHQLAAITINETGDHFLDGASLMWSRRLGLRPTRPEPVDGARPPDLQGGEVGAKDGADRLLLVVKRATSSRPEMVSRRDQQPIGELPP